MAGSLGDPRYARIIDTLRSERLRLGLSQANLAAKLRKPQQFVSKYEGLERRLDIVELIDVATALGLSTPDLIAACVALESRVD